jgi:hypothetical protein
VASSTLKWLNLLRLPTINIENDQIMNIIILRAHNSCIQTLVKELQRKSYKLQQNIPNVVLHISIICHLTHVFGVLVIGNQTCILRELWS